MPTFEVTSPDGTKYRVNAPEGATQAQAISYVQQNMERTAKDPYEETAAGQSTAQNLLAGIGGGMKSLYLGGKQILGMDAPGEIDEHRRAMSGLTTTKAGLVGDILGQATVGIPAAFIPGANTMAGAALTGASFGALQPTIKDESRVMNMALGAGGGVAGKWVGDKAVRLMRGSNAANSAGANAQASASPGVSSASSDVSGSATATGSGGGYGFGFVGDDASAGLTRGQAEAMRKGRDLGMQLTPGQASGSRALQQLEAKLESQPMTSGRFNQIKANNQTVLNRAAAQSIGETADVLDDATLAQARDRITGVYKMVADKRPRQIDADGFINQLSSVENEFEGLLPGSVLDNPLTKRLFSYAEKGQATGEQLQDLASKLGKAANGQMTSGTGDRQLGMALFKVKDMADDLLASGLSGDTAKLFADARGQYRNLMLLTQRVGTVNPTTGNVSGANLANLLQQKDKAGYLYGGNQTDMYNAARFAQGFKPIVGDSGTATRMPLPSPTDFVLSLPFNVATRAYTSAPAVNLAANAANISRNGMAPVFGGLLDPAMPQAMGYAGGLLGSRLSN